MPQTFSDDNYVYSVDMMFAYLKNNEHTVTKINVNEYMDTLEYSGWGDPGKNIYYSAMDVINNPMLYQDDYKRILYADLSYPIIISSEGYIVDGVHRLSKVYLEKKEYISAYIFDEKLMKKFIIAKKTPDVWEKIDTMQTYEIVDIYYKRFCKNGNSKLSSS